MSRLPPAPDISGVLENSQSNEAHRSLSRSSSGSSHSSHSSHQERKREQHLGERRGGPPSVFKPMSAGVAILIFLFVGQAVALWLFTQGFLLTRTSLNGISTCNGLPQHRYVQPSNIPTDISSHESFQEWENILMTQSECTLPAKFSRTFMWIIDALRYDFIADIEKYQGSTESNWEPDPHHHGVLNLPASENRKQGQYSFLAHFLADAPTTTLQRLKGLTTGSLPTFIDAGANFGGSEIQEDNWIAQLRSQVPVGANAKMGMAGDDTWLTVFPSLFDQEWEFPFESFNVEDLDGVDRGVEKSIKPFLEFNNATLSDWRLLVAHTLGVDHVGHRLGASHPRMRSKLTEMRQFLDHILNKLPQDALFILMGDHGMDDKGDHGGDGELEVGAGLWLYSKQKSRQRIPIETLESVREKAEHLISSTITFSKLPTPPFPPHRSVPQIDLVPTVSLLLGLPIPFNNLGTVIPEAFTTSEQLLRALRINAIQVNRYLRAYGEQSNDLKPFEKDLSLIWTQALRNDHRYIQSSSKQTEIEAMQTYFHYNRAALLHARSVWAKFENTKIFLGLILFLLNIASLMMIQKEAQNTNIENVITGVYSRSRNGALIGGLLALSAKTISKYLIAFSHLNAFSLLEITCAGVTAGAQMNLLVTWASCRSKQNSWSNLGVALPLLHGLAFSSNSFTVQEDKVTLTLFISVVLYRGLQGYLASPGTRLKLRLPTLALVAGITARLSALSRVCREEQGPTCQTTFYYDAQSTLNSPWALCASYVSALLLPSLVGRVLSFSRSNAGVAPLFLSWIFRPALLLGSGFWVLDWLLTADVIDLKINSAAQLAMEWAKLAVARVDFALLGPIALAFWIFMPLCIDLSEEKVSNPEKSDVAEIKARSTPDQSPATRLIILGFANSFGSSYLLLYIVIFAVHFLVAQAMGQIALSLLLISLLAIMELGDGERDIYLLQRNVLQANTIRQSNAPEENNSHVQSLDSTVTIPPSTLETSTLALLGFLAFFATGHQATFASIQWRTAFVGFRTVEYPYAPVLVALNSFGPLALLTAFAVPLLVFWNLAPKPRSGQKKRDTSDHQSEVTHEEGLRMPTFSHILQASLSFLLYHVIVTFATAAFASYFRRHL